MAQDSDYVDPSISNNSKSKGKARFLEPIDSDSDLDIEIDGLDSEDELLLSSNNHTNNKKRRKLNNNTDAAKNDGKSKSSSKKLGGKSGRGGLGKSKDQGYAWEATFKRSWEAVQEDEGGSLANSVKKLLQGNRRNRTLQDSSPVQRGIIRHLVLILDLSEAMNEKDLRPNRHDLTLSLASAFVAEYFDQNPIGQLSILGTRSGISERLLPMGGNIVEALSILSNKRKLEPKGEPSLQNSLEMARTSLSHLPISNTREILFLFGSLTTCDPGNIHETLESLIRDRIKVNIICLSAEIRICKTISEKTKGKFGVVLNEDHYRDLVLGFVNPPEIEASEIKSKAKQKKSKRIRNQNGQEEEEVEDDDDDEEDEDEEGGIDLMQMGFPLKLSSTSGSMKTGSGISSLCSCHSKLKSHGYKCPRCGVKICQIPTDCSVCGLTVVLSTHLARSYHHLFPVENFRGVDWISLTDEDSSTCFGCSIPFPKSSSSSQASTNPSTLNPPSKGTSNGILKSNANGQGQEQGQRSKSNHSKKTNPSDPVPSIDELSPTERYRCRKCLRDFCLDCDTFVHEILFSCPGCC